MIQTYRKKPMDIQAVQWTGLNFEEIRTFVGDSLFYELEDTTWCSGVIPPRFIVMIRTLEGDLLCSVGDYIIRGIRGEFYPCKPDIFEDSYELVSEGGRRE